MTPKARSSVLQLSIAFVPTILSVLYFRWNSLPTILDASSHRPMLEMSNIQKSDSAIYNSLTTNATSISAFDKLHEQYSKACPEHTYKTRIFSMDPLIIYLENYITAPEREYILNKAELTYVQSEVAAGADGERIRALVTDERSSQSAYFYDDPVTRCIQKRSASFQGDVPVDRVEGLQAVKYTVNDHFRYHWDWWEGTDNPRVSSIFAYLACDSGESGGGGQCEGGATEFPDYLNNFPIEWCDVIDCYADCEGVSFKPVVGNAIFWSNVHPNGTYHKGTCHAGMPVKKGRKVGLNVWTHQDEFFYPVELL